MTQFKNKSFTVHMGANDAYRDNWERTFKKETPAVPVCATCEDTHHMALGEREVPCTRCPRPCQTCRLEGKGAYCTTTPCGCACHAEGKGT